MIRLPSKADILLHPIRMRIVQELSKSEATGLELFQQLQDVPQATFYRHLKTLVEHNLVAIVEGTANSKDRVYTLQTDGSQLTASDVKELPPEEHMRLFTMFTSQLLQQAETYFETEPDYTTAKFGYGRVDLHLKDEEWEAFRKEIAETIQRYAKLKRRPDTTTISLTQYLLPQTIQGGNKNET